MAGRMTLAEQMTQLYDVAPLDYDPESLHDDIVSHTPNHAAPEDPAIPLPPGTSDLAREHYLPVEPSLLRKQQQSVSDPKYDGVTVSRKELLEDNDDDEELQSGSDDDDRDVDDDDELPPHPDTVSQPAPESTSSTNPPHDAAPDTTDTLSALKRTRLEDRKKGTAVSTQIAIYDTLLDARIRLQKCAAGANRLPHPSTLPSYLLTPHSRALTNKFLKEAESLQESLFELREKLLKADELDDVLEKLPERQAKRRKISESSLAADGAEDQENDEDIDWEDRLRRTAQDVASFEVAYHPHLLTTLHKWSQKVLAVAPQALVDNIANQSKFTSRRAAGGSGPGGVSVKGAVELISESLSAVGRDTLIGRTRVRRGVGTGKERIGMKREVFSDSREGQAQAQARVPHSEQPQEQKEEEDPHDPETFDDTDFYQQLLRDVIDARSNNNNENTSHGLDGEEADWKESQKARKARKKSALDTRASKGRKMRYETHEKLLHFMPPIRAPLGTAAWQWHEQQADELFASLLGRGLTLSKTAPGGDTDGNGLEGGGEGGDVIEESVERMDVDLDAGVLGGGFRVFG